MSLLVGPVVGPVVGPKVGPNGDVSSDPLAGVTRDASSGIYCPASAAEWAIVLAVAGITSGGPSALWLLQEASGNAADSIGSFTLTASGTVAYQQAVTGWTRKCVSFTDGVAGNLLTTSGSLPDLLTTSHMVLTYTRTPASAPGSARNLVCLGATTTKTDAATVPTTGKLRSRSGGNSADGTTAFCDGGVHPVVVRSNRTAGEADAYNKTDKVSPAFDVLTAGQGVRFGAGQLQAASSGCLFAVSFHGAAAELSDAQEKTLLQTLGWPITF